VSLFSPTSPLRTDPRYPFAALLTFYAVLGCTTLGFNRSPLQLILTIAAACALEMLFARIFREPSRYAPLSAYISSCGLGLLLNYSHNLWLLLPPVFVMVASKYLVTFNGKHVYNPSMFAVVMALLVGGDLYAPAPAYQWGHWIGLPIFIVTAGLSLFIFRVQRQWLVGAFLVFYLIQTCIRAWLLRHHLPPATLLYGTFSAPSLYLFTFFMITDPRTSPEGRKPQILVALGLVTLDFLFHWRRSYETLFYSAFTLATGRFLYLHIRRLIQTRGKAFSLLLTSKWLQRAGVIAAFTAAGFFLFHSWIFRAPTVSDTGFTFAKIESSQSGIQAEPGTVLEEIDPRVRHIAKWLLSVGDAVAVADFDNDGQQDLFLTNPVKRPEDRNALYRNAGGLRFERVPLPALDEVSRHPETHGLSAGAAFADYDDDGDQDLLITTGYGPCRLLRNELTPSGKVSFTDVSHEVGISEHSVSLAATFFDANRDGLLDLLICNSFTPYLRDYEKTTPFNVFKLPQPEYEGDRRMFHFMHQGWHDAANGGGNFLYLGTREGKLVKQDSKAWGLDGNRWSLAVGTTDVNGDGFTDLYIANDFGPDEFYMNEGGKRFRKIIGSHFGSIGRDTYKGMNVSIADLRNTGDTDIYISNVHAPLQAEGSLLWHMQSDPKDPMRPHITDTATERGALNARAFGWGAGIGDLNLDGWQDIVQANGMVDDSIDRQYTRPPDYWYTATLIMLSGPSVHAYADRWADLRGCAIWGWQQNKVLLNQGNDAGMQFREVQEAVGMPELGNSRGVALADFDNDGDLDCLITHQFKNASFYRNDLAKPRAWLGLELRGDGHSVNRDAIGTRVRLTRKDAQGRELLQTREVQCISGFSAQGDRRLLFGLGDVPHEMRVQITWPDGREITLDRLEPNKYHRIEIGKDVAQK
jgi:hypothetical protein